MRPVSLGPVFARRSARPCPSSPNFANFGTRAPCWAAQARARMHGLRTASPGDRSCLQSWEPPGAPISSPIPSPTIKTNSQLLGGGQAPAGGVRESVPNSAPTPARGPAATSARARRSPLSSPCRLPGSFVALAGRALWNAWASRSQALPPPTPHPPPPPRLGEGLGEGEQEERRVKLGRRSPSFGGLSAGWGWGWGIWEPSFHRAPCGGKMRASRVPELL